MSDASESAAIALPPAVEAASIADQSAEASTYAYWQRRILLSSIVGYALYYFVRKNLSAAMPFMEEDLGIGKPELGLFLTAHGLLYGVSKFANGLIGDRTNARWFMVSGLVICAIFNILFGLSTAVLAFGLLWAANGWFQGMGFPPCARLMTHWFPPRRLASKMAIWNSSHSLGTAGVVVLCGYLAPIDWRLCFFVPAAIVLFGAAILSFTLRDTPESMGLPPVDGTEHSDHEVQPLMDSLRRWVLDNRTIWMIAIANFFVYAIRYGILDWAPSFLKQARDIEFTSATWLVALFEGAGLLGMLTAGWMTDRIFGGRAIRACLVYMTMTTLALLLFWLYPTSSWIGNAALLSAAGFFVYGPQSLIGAAAANMATKRAAAAAVGFTGLFGYASTTLSGVGIGVLVKHYGWDAGFLLFLICGFIGVFLFALCWNAKAHGYATN